MDKRLYEFLKGKGCEFCYKDKEPFLIDSRVSYEWLVEYDELAKNSFINKHEEDLTAIISNNSSEIECIRLYNHDTDKMFRLQTLIQKNNASYFIVRYKELLYSVIAHNANVSKIIYDTLNNK